MHAIVFNKVTNRIVSVNRQTMLLTLNAVDQIEKDLSFEVRHFQLVDVVSEESLIAFVWNDVVDNSRSGDLSCLLAFSTERMV